MLSFGSRTGQTGPTGRRTKAEKAKIQEAVEESCCKWQPSTPPYGGDGGGFLFSYNLLNFAPNSEIMQYFFLITGALLLAYIVYFSCNKGMARNARGQQTRRLGVAAVLACIPLTVAQVPVTTPSLLLVAGISGLWMLTYPLLYHLTHRKSSPDYENYMDIDFGLYLLAVFQVCWPCWRLSYRAAGW